MQILTHRGLEPLNNDFHYFESSSEAFENQLNRGFGLEFDINFTGDGHCFVFHDASLKRVSEGRDERNFQELSKRDIEGYILGKNNHFISFTDLIKLIDKYRKKGEYSSLHLKSKFQENIYIDEMLKILAGFEGIEEKIFIFDVKIETAKYIKIKNKNIKLFPSVSHDYDIKRYNECIGGTLFSIDDVLDNIELFDGVWLDEWDKKNNTGLKTFYNEKTFSIFRERGLLIGLVTPELHAKSPGLLGGESHEDCSNLDTLKLRFKDIINLKPDFICSDYLEFLK